MTRRNQQHYDNDDSSIASDQKDFQEVSFWTSGMVPFDILTIG